MDRKHLDIKREGDWIVASTPDVDRDRDRVMPMGLSLDNYRKNPVLFYGHSYAEPWNLIGKAAEIEQDASGLRIRAELREPANENDPMHIVRALWESGLLRAASIGFTPIEAQPNEKGGRDINRAELLEISLVPIPANQSALRLAAKAMDMAADDVPFDTLAQLKQDDFADEVIIPDAHKQQMLGAGVLSSNSVLSSSANLHYISTDNAVHPSTTLTVTPSATWTIHVINTKADTDVTKEADAPAEEAKQEVSAEPEQDEPAPVDDTAAEQAQAEAQAELRLAAILADFVNSIRPYLLQS